MHTPLCKHATGHPDEYADAAAKLGLAGITITCHCPLPDGNSPWARMDISQLSDYLSLIEGTRKKYLGKVDVLLGLESDYYPGIESWLKDLHARAPFNYILGSVHPHIDEYKKNFYRGDAREFQITYFKHLADAAESALFDSISHPDLVKNCYPTEWNPNKIIDEIRASLDRIAKSGVAMELNTSGLNKEIKEMNPGPVILREMCIRNIPVVIGSDSHVPTRVGADFGRAIKILTEAGYTETNYFVNRKRRTVAFSNLNNAF